MNAELPAAWSTARLTVRDALEEDAAACCEVFNSCVRKLVRDPAFERLISVDLARSWILDHRDKRLPLPNPRMQVALLEGRLVAQIQVAHGHIKPAEFPGVAWISMLAVHAPVQGWGFGSELLDGLVNQFAALDGFEKVQLKVYARNTPGLQFLVNAGFHRIVNLGWEATANGCAEPPVGIVLERDLPRGATSPCGAMSTD